MAELGPNSPLQVGPFRLLERLGGGGMAEVYLARREDRLGFEKYCALKMIQPRHEASATLRQMLEQEARFAALLSHTNIVQLLDMGEVDNRLYLALEYVRGRDLAEISTLLARQRRPLPIPLALFIAVEFLTGLDYVHRLENEAGEPLGLIHRDVSPQNILLSYEGEVKLTDFGIAQALIAPVELDEAGFLRGKIAYCSPEQVASEPLDQRSDVFSAGVVLYELLTGVRLFRRAEVSETIRAIVSDPVPPPSSLNSDVSVELDRVLARSLQRSRERRYQSVGAMLGDLARLADRWPARASKRELAAFLRRELPVSDPASWRARFQNRFPCPGPGKTPLGRLLIDEGKIEERDLELALALQRAAGRRLGEILLAEGLIGESDLAEALARQVERPYLSPDELDGLTPDPHLVSVFPRSIAEETLCLPIAGAAAGQISMVCADPNDADALFRVRSTVSARELDLSVSTRGAVERAIARWYANLPMPTPAPPGPRPTLAMPLERDLGATVPQLVIEAGEREMLKRAFEERVRGNAKAGALAATSEKSPLRIKTATTAEIDLTDLPGRTTRTEPKKR